MEPIVLKVFAACTAALVFADAEPALAHGGGGFPGGGGGAFHGGGMAGGGGGAHFSRGAGALPGGGYQRVAGGGTKEYSRPSGGGRLPSHSTTAGGINHSQVASKAQSHPRGSASVLPSAGQGKRTSAATHGNKGNFPDLAAKTGAGEKLARQGGGTQGGKIQGRQPGGQLTSGQRASNLTTIGQQSHATGFLDKSNASDWAKNRSPQWNQAVKNNQAYWNQWSANNQGKLADFRANRATAWSNTNNFWNNRNPSNTFHSPEWNNYSNQVNQFRSNRAIEVNNYVQNNFNNNFDNHWWGHCGWWSGPVVATNPWWWWGAATFAGVGTFLALDAIQDANYTPPVYDYGVNVVPQGDEVYVDGHPTTTTTEYAQQANALANEPATQPPPPMPPEEGKPAEWLPLGVWALAQEEKGNAYMFFQISVNREGVISGAYKNVLSGEQSPISGQVDKKTQRAAWKIGTNTVIETGLQSLTQDVASCLVHFGENNAQTWLLVRLKQPEMPNAPQTASPETTG